MKKIVLASVAVVFAGGAIGGFSTFYTGNAEEIPKWNGVDYFIFGIRDGMFLSLPLAAVLFLLLFGFRKRRLKP